jgi:pimeloyl-ACP methyl ester carboxylesterase
MEVKPRLRRFQSLGPHGFHDIAYTEWGDPESDHLVFCVHGFTRNARDFDPLAASLSDRCHVVCMDVVGRGASDWLPYKGDYSFGLYLTDAAALMARVTAPRAEREPEAQPQPEKPLRRGLFGRRKPVPAASPAPERAPRRERKRVVDWIGTSMGGLMGMMIASKRNTPIRRLVLNDVGPLVPWPALARLKQIHSGLNKRFATPAEVEQHMRETCAAFGPLDDALWQHVARYGAIRQDDGSYVLSFDPAIISHMRASTVAGIEFGSEFLFGVNLWPTYDVIQCETLLLRGGQSDLLLKSTAEEMAKRGPRARLVEFPGIGHAPWLMTPEQIGPIRDFLFAPEGRAVNVPAAPPVRALHPVHS